LPALLARPPAAEGWQRTRWSCATLVLSLRARRGIQISAETMQRWLHQLGWRWKRAKLAAPDNDPERVPKLARIRLIWETLRLCDVLLFADELDIPLLPKSGYQRMPQGTQVEVLTPGKNQKRYLAGAWDGRTGLLHHCCGLRKSNELFRNLLEILARRYPAGHYECVYVVVDNYKIHKAQSVERWLAAQQRFHLLWFPHTAR
jgi:IS1 family transposase